MNYRISSIVLAGVASLLCSAALSAQDDYRGHPAERVRLQKTENHTPDPIYPQNRVILRKVNLVPAGGTGMQINGEIVTDFDADRVPAGQDLPRGQLEGLKIRVELYQYETVLDRERGGQVKAPQISAKDHGMLVAGQSTVVEIDSTFGPYGMGRFELPALDKPLAPGVYKLVAGLHFRTQDVKLREAVKWCSGLYGAEIEVQIQDGKAVNVILPVMGDKDRHETWYRELTEHIGKIEDTTQLWIGATRTDGRYDLVTPHQGTDRKPANHMLWTLHHEMVSQVIAFEDQLDNVDEIIDADLERRKGLEGANQEMIERWEKEAEEEKRRIRRDNQDLITTYGGRTSREEQRMHAVATAARQVILEQIIAYQEYLTYKYWVLADGVLTYRGWHTVNHPAHQAFDAISKQDARAAKLARIDNIEAAKEAEGGLRGKWDRRTEAWRYQPPEVIKYAFDYLRTKEERDTWDPENFTMELSGEDKLVLDVAEWSKYRNEFMADYIELTEKLFAEVTTTELYANQTWPKALSEARQARDEVITLSYSWEYHIRTDRMGESRETIQNQWREQAQQNPTMRLERFFRSAAQAPGTVYGRFRGNISSLKSTIKLTTFTQRYRVAIDAGAEKADLPGRRPPSAPPEAK